MSKYTEVTYLLQEKVNNNVFTFQEAEALNKKAFEKYATSEDTIFDITESFNDILDFENSKEFNESYEEYKKIAAGIQDRYDTGEITFEQALEINELAYDKYVTEAGLSPIKKHLRELEAIKNAKPNEYDGDAEIKKFVDANYDKIKKATDILQKEPDKLKKNEIAITIEAVVGYILVLLSFPASAMSGGGLFILAFLIWLLTISIHSWVVYLRSHDDVAAIKQLTKIKKSLEKVNSKKLPENYKKKVSALIAEIDDAETELYQKIKKAD